MEKKLNSIVNALRTNQVRRRRFTAVMIVLSMIVSSSVFWQLHSTGNAMSDELLCGMSEHVHTAECLATELACSEDHEHTQECYKIIFTCSGTEHLHTEQCWSDISADTETSVDWEATLPEKMTDDRRENLAAVAESQLGYTESTNNFIIADDGVTRKGYTRYGDWYGNPYGDWNALFAYFCLYYAGITENELPYGSGCWAWTQELKKAELFSSPEDITVSVGDLVFLDTDSDEKPDRVGIVSEVRDEKTGITFTAIEGDLGGAVDKADYSLADEMLAGVVSLENLSYNAEEIMAEDFEAINPYSVDLLADGNNQNNVFISITGQNGYTQDYIQNATSDNDRIVVYPGDRITLKVTLERKYGAEKSNAYYTHIDNKPSNVSESDWQIKSFWETKYYLPANIWSDNGWDKAVNNKYDLTSKDQVIYFINEYIVPDTSGACSITYNSCDFGNSEKVYIWVADSNSQPGNNCSVEIKDHPGEGASPPRDIYAGGTVTVIAKTNDYAYYKVADSYQQKTLTNGQTIWTPVYLGYANVIDGKWNWDSAARITKQTNEDTYSIDSNGYLIIENTFTAGSYNDDGLVDVYAQKYWNSVHFNVNKDDNFGKQKQDVFQVYTAIGWKDKNEIHEAQDGKGGDYGDGKYHRNSRLQYYVLHPKDWVYLTCNGNIDVNRIQIYNVNDENNPQLITDLGSASIGLSPQNVGGQNCVKVQMPDTCPGNTYYKVVYNYTDNSGQQCYDEFFIKFTNGHGSSQGIVNPESFNQTSGDYYDHADIEIADGGTYTVESEYVNEKGETVKLTRVYLACVEDINYCDITMNPYDDTNIYLSDEIKNKAGYPFPGSQTQLRISQVEYYQGGKPGETQYELTSKWHTDANRQKLLLPNDTSGMKITNRRMFKQNNVKNALFDVQVYLIPQKETLTVNNAPQQHDDSDFRNSGTVEVSHAQITLERQSVIDACNKCPDHSGLDFTIAAETVTDQLRSGTAQVQIKKAFQDSNGKQLAQQEGQFTFELYEIENDGQYWYKSENGKPVRKKAVPLDSNAVNTAEGNVYFDALFYLDLDLEKDDEWQFLFYEIVEKPQSGTGIKYDERSQMVRVIVKPDGNKYTTEVTYFQHYVDINGDNQWDFIDKIPTFTNILQLYELPSTGGGGTTIFYLSGTAIMLTAGAVLLRRRRREEKRT